MSNSPLSRIDESLKQIALTAYPPVDKWNPAYEGEIDIVIRADGSWLHEGGEFKRDSLVKLFASVLWYEEGQHYLKTPAEKMRIQVEDAAFFFILLDVVDPGTEQQQLVFTSSYGDVVVAGPEHRLWVDEDEETGEPSPYLAMRYGMKGKLSRSVFTQLAEHLQTIPDPDLNQANCEECLVVKSQGIDFILGKLS